MLFAQLRRSSPFQHADEALSGSFVVSGGAGSQHGYDVYPVKGIPSCIPRSDVLLLEIFQPGAKQEPPKLVSLPVSPYPVHKDTRVRAHFVADSQGPLLSLGQHNWAPWMGNAGIYRAWAECTVRGYRDFAGREAHVGSPNSILARVLLMWTTSAWDLRSVKSYDVYTPSYIRILWRSNCGRGNRRRSRDGFGFANGWK